VIRETQHIDQDGQHTTERRVEHFPSPMEHYPPPKSAPSADLTHRAKPRARGTGRRPKAQATSSRRAGDSGDDDLGESDEPPPSGRLCEFCDGDIPVDRSPLAKYCTTQHADRDRQRRKRDRDRPGEVVGRLVVCRCDDPLEFEPGHCTKCGRSLPPGIADRLEELVRRPLQPRREQLLDLADRLRGLEELNRGEQLALDLEERVA
jgi:hypothetical protein